MSSRLSDTMKRTSDMLKSGASNQILEYERRFSSLRDLYETLFSNLIVTKFDCREAMEVAEEFFGVSNVRFAGVDGTMYAHPLFDLIIFFGGAYASTGTVTFKRDDKPKIEYDERTIRQNAGISSVVPVYINQILDIDHTFTEDQQPNEVKPLRDDTIISNATIANWMMTFSEFYLAYKLSKDPEQNIRIILLDRSLSVERASLLYDTSKRELWESKSGIIGYKIDGETCDANDLLIARQHVYNQSMGLPPLRGDFLQYAIVNSLKRNGPLTEKQILMNIDIRDQNRAKRVNRYLKRLVVDNILIKKDHTYSLNAKYRKSWERVKKLVERLGDRFFYSKKPELEALNLLRIVKDGKMHWITTLDLAFVTLFTLHMLMEECWKKRVLLVGMTKDTSARDFKRQLVPIMQKEGLLKRLVSLGEFGKLPNTDRMILQSASMLNLHEITVPWGLVEYDSAFRTMVVDKQNRRGYVLGAIKNRVGLEKTFLKSYVQLSQAKTNPMLRSNVLLVDRLVHPEYDYKPENVVKFWNEFGGAREPIEVILFIDNTVQNKLQNLTMTVLSAMTPSSIPEAFGHNKPLFIADKIAKWHYQQFKRVVDTTAVWMLNSHELRRFIFYMSTFRERRATIEATRKERM